MKYRLYIFFLSLAISLNTSASKPNLDSLQQLLSNQNPKTRIWGLEELIDYYQYRNNDSALKYALIGVDVAEKANLISKLGDFLISLGDAYVEKSDYAKALDKYILAEKCFKEVKNLKGAILAINNIGYVYEHQNLPSTAIIQYETALSVATRIDDKSQMADSYNLLGSVYFNKYEDEKALENFTKALEIYKQLNLEQKVVEGLNNIAVVFKDMGRLDEALNNFKSLLNYSEKKAMLKIK
ncbi:MAG: tetratricopeptide repeat protein [Sphingobacteriaceae bacterium]|nr:tetratricopeptide repeat protein [Sphingobacteriaceae bacterium]